MSAPVHLDEPSSPAAFLDAQRAFYRGDPNYVPPLTAIDKAQVDPRKNPFFARARAAFWLGRRGDAVVGRISAVRNDVHDEFWGERAGFFGHFEAADEDAAHAMLDGAAEWLRRHGADTMRGPIDLSTNYRTGVLLPDLPPSPPLLMMPHSRPQYPAWLESWGLAKAKDLVAWHLDTDTMDLERLARLDRRLRERARLTLRPIAMRRFDREVGLIWELYNRIWERNWGFVPMSRAEFDKEARGFKSICVPELIQLAAVAGEPAGFIVSLPDANRAIAACDGRLLPFGWWRLWRALRRVDHMRVITLGVLPEHRGSGADASLIQATVEAGVAHGIHRCEAGWVLEDNRAMNAPLERLGARICRRYRVYERPLPP